MYSATNVELVTRSRTEHLSDQDKLKSKGNSPFEKLNKLFKSAHKQQQRELIQMYDGFPVSAITLSGF